MRRKAERQKEAPGPGNTPREVVPSDRTYSEAIQGKAEECTTVMSKGKRKERLREELAKVAGNTPVSLRDPGKSGAAGTKRAGLERPRRIQDRHLLQILPKDDAVNSILPSIW